MIAKVLSSDQARAHWRNIIDAAVTGENVVIERYGKPMAVVIAYEDFLELEEYLQDIRDAREAKAILEEWQRDPTSAEPWADVKDQLLGMTAANE